MRPTERCLFLFPIFRCLKVTHTSKFSSTRLTAYFILPRHKNGFGTQP